MYFTKFGRCLAGEFLENRMLLTSVLVTDGGDSGPGTFRNAIAEANANSAVNAIVFDGVSTTNLESTVEYTNGQRLSIRGNGRLSKRQQRALMTYSCHLAERIWHLVDSDFGMVPMESSFPFPLTRPEESRSHFKTWPLQPTR